MTQFILFGGKGGVGKTTCAAATALKLSEEGDKILIASTDPAHSLSDSFEKKIGSREKEIFPNLWAVEINPKEEMQKLKEKLADAPEMPNMPGLPGMNPAEMLGGLSDMGSMPGMDEMAAFDIFLKYMDSEEYDYVIFDTAPTGHTLKFLSLPELMDSWVGKMIKFKLQVSNALNMFKQLLPFTEPKEDKSLENLEKMKARIEKGKLILTNPSKTNFVIVTIPQEMAISESVRAVKQLEEFGIPVKKIIVNQIQPEHKSCAFCTARRKLHKEKLNEIHKKFKKKQIVEVELSKDEIKGKKKLEEFARVLK